MKDIRLAIITTHPIQYYAPVFKLLHERGNITINVFYTFGVNGTEKFDEGFDKIIEWDISFLNGYPFEWVSNTANTPSSAKFKGIRNPGLISQVEQWKPNAILVYGWAYHSHLQVLHFFKNKLPVFFRGDSTCLDDVKGPKTIVKDIFKTWIYKHIDYALYVGSQNKAYFKKLGLKESQLIFVPHAVDNERFAMSDLAKVKLTRENLGLKQHDVLILFAGKFEQKKDPMILLRAFSELNMPSVSLLFVGSGYLEETLKAESEKSGNVHIWGFQNQSEMPGIYQACDIFCLPSKGPAETWGLAVNEAMACGKAILVSDRGGCAIDLVEQGKNGEIFKAGNLNDLTDKLKGMVSEGKVGLSRMGRYSQEIIQAWNFGTQVKTIEASLHEK